MSAERAPRITAWYAVMTSAHMHQSVTFIRVYVQRALPRVWLNQELVVGYLFKIVLTLMEDGFSDNNIP